MANTARLQNILMATSLSDKSFSAFEDLVIWAFLRETAEELKHGDTDLSVKYNEKENTIELVRGNIELAASIMYANTKKRVTFWVSGFRGDEDVIAASVERMADFFTPRLAAAFIRKQMQ